MTRDLPELKMVAGASLIVSWSEFQGATLRLRIVTTHDKGITATLDVYLAPDHARDLVEKINQLLRNDGEGAQGALSR